MRGTAAQGADPELAPFKHLESQQAELRARHSELASANQLRKRIANFAARVTDSIEHLDFDHRQRLLRLVVEEVRVTGWQVEVCLRVPLDDKAPDGASPPSRKPKSPAPRPRSQHQSGQADQLSSHDGLRSTHLGALHHTLSPRSTFWRPSPHRSRYPHAPQLYDHHGPGQ
jgi:hypothetical protein